jgi:hypothetical protein
VYHKPPPPELVEAASSVPERSALA